MKFLPLIFLVCIVFFHRPEMLTGHFSNGITIFARWGFALLASAFLLFQWERVIHILKTFSKWENTALLILLISALGHFFHNGYFTLESLGLNLFFLTIPFFACVNKSALVKLFPWCMSGLWFLSLILYFLQRGRSFSWVGFVGNWNWNGTMILVMTPFVILLIFRYMGRSEKKFAWSLSTVVCLISGLLFVLSHSRAAWIGLAGSLFLLLCLSLNGRKRKILLYSGIGGIAAGILLLTLVFPDKLDALFMKEVRPAIWESTVKLLKDFPLGTGAESFEDRYIPYKSLEYFMNPHASMRTIHPHNEFLNLAVLLGIPALLAWCFLTFKGMFLFLRGYRRASVEMKIIFYTFVCILIHSLFDLVLFSWPLEEFGFLFAGLFWTPLLRADREPVKYRILPQLLGWVILTGVILSGWNNFRATWHFDQARQAGLRKDVMGMQSHSFMGAELSSAFPELLYRRLEQMILFDRNYAAALKLSEALEKTPYRNILRIHALKALAYSMLNRDEEAIQEYLKDLASYPHLILSRIGLLNAYGRLGKSAELPAVRYQLNEWLRIRGLSKEDLEKIMRYPECDENQHKLKEIPSAMKETFSNR